MIILLFLVGATFLAWLLWMRTLPDTPENPQRADPAASAPMVPVPSPPQVSPSPEPESSALPSSEHGTHTHVIRARRGVELPDFFEIVRRANAGELPVDFVIETFEKEKLRLRVVGATSQVGGRAAALRGEIPGHPGSLVALTQVGAAVSGSIQIPTEGVVLEVRSADGVVTLEEIDTEALGECATCMSGHVELEPVAPEPPPES